MNKKEKKKDSYQWFIFILRVKKIHGLSKLKKNKDR